MILGNLVRMYAITEAEFLVFNSVQHTSMADKIRSRSFGLIASLRSLIQIGDYQNEGKIDDHFEQCLDTIVNFRKRKRALEMYADWRRYPDECREVCDKLSAKYAKRAKRLLAKK